MEHAKTFSAVAALLVAALLAFSAFYMKDDVSANMLILIAQFLMYSLTLYGFGELARKIYKNSNSHVKRKMD